MTDTWYTVGEDETVGKAAPGSAITRAPFGVPAAPAAPALAPALARPGALPFLPGALRPSGVTEERAREIAREEIRALRDILPASYRQPTLPVDDPESMFVLGFSVATMNATTTTATITASPQRGFRGERLVVDVRRIGASAQTAVVSLTGIRVGEASQLVGSGAIPAETFSPSAFGVRLAMDPSGPGIVISLDFLTLGLLTPDEVRVTAAVIGRVRRGAVAT